MSKSQVKGRKPWNNVNKNDEIFLDKVRAELQELAETIQLDTACIGKSGQCGYDQLTLAQIKPVIEKLAEDFQKNGARDIAQNTLLLALFKIFKEPVLSEATPLMLKISHYF
jgi:hypothetical protein